MSSYILGGRGIVKILLRLYSLHKFNLIIVVLHWFHWFYWLHRRISLCFSVWSMFLSDIFYVGLSVWMFPIMSITPIDAVCPCFSFSKSKGKNHLSAALHLDLLGVLDGQGREIDWLPVKRSASLSPHLWRILILNIITLISFFKMFQLW